MKVHRSKNRSFRKHRGFSLLINDGVKNVKTRIVTRFWEVFYNLSAPPRKDSHQIAEKEIV